MGSSPYSGAEVVPEDAFTTYTESWSADPRFGTPWTAAGVSAISAFGYRSTSISAGDSALTAWVSQCNLKTYWYPIRPSVNLYIYKNGAALESSRTPIYESLGAATYQTASIASIVHLHTGDTIDIRVVKTVISDTISAGSVNTNLSIHRLAGPLG
jgi:hypothetical protein